MVRVLKTRIVESSLLYIEGACVEADVTNLPTDGFVTGSKMTCADTGNVYMFYEDETTPGWGKIIAGPTVEAAET